MIVVTDDHDDDPSTEPQPVSSTPNQHDTNDISRNNSIFSRCVHSNTNTNGDGGVDIDEDDDDDDDGSRRTGNSDDVSATPLDDTFDRLLLLVVPLDNVTDDDDDEDDDDISVVVSTSSLASLASFL